MNIMNTQLDPMPYREPESRYRHRYQTPYYVTVFDPRPEYEQDESKYL